MEQSGGEEVTLMGSLALEKPFKMVASPIQTYSGILNNVTSISCDELSTTAIRSDGTAWKSEEEVFLPSLKCHKSISESLLYDRKSFYYYKQLSQQKNDKDDALLASQETFLTKNTETASYDLDSVPEEPFNVSIVATEPYQAPAQIELVASITHPSNTIISKVEFYDGEKSIKTKTEAPYEFVYADVPIGIHRIQAIAYDSEGKTTSATTEFEVIPSNRYNRGFGTNQCYLSSIIALDFERGIPCDGISDFKALYPEENYP